MTSTHIRFAAAVALLLLFTACASPPPVDTTDTATSTTTSRTPRFTDDSDRPDVTFDPCLDIPDDALITAGYDPASKTHADAPMGNYTFLGCYYKGTLSIPGELGRYGLNILAGNVTLDEELAVHGDIATHVVLDGRPALLEVEPDGRSCTYVVETDFGIVIFNRNYHPDHTRGITVAQRCDGAEDTARQLARFIDTEQETP